MKITTIKAGWIDKYGFRYTHKTTHKIFKNKQVAIETIGSETNPLYKRITDGKNVREFDKGLFGWELRK